MNLTDRLDGMMKLRGIKSKAELARLSGIPYTTIDGIYKKGSENMTLRTLRRLCSFFGCTMDYLANGVEGKAIDNPLIYALIDAAEMCNDDDIRIAVNMLEKDGYYNQRLKDYAEKYKEMKNSEAENV